MGLLGAVDFRRIGSKERVSCPGEAWQVLPRPRWGFPVLAQCVRGHLQLRLTRTEQSRQLAVIIPAAFPQVLVKTSFSGVMWLPGAWASHEPLLPPTPHLSGVNSPEAGPGAPDGLVSLASFVKPPRT